MRTRVTERESKAESTNKKNDLRSAIENLAQQQAAPAPATAAERVALEEKEAALTQAASEVETAARDENEGWIRTANIRLLIVLGLAAVVTLLVGRPWSDDTRITRHAFSIAVVIAVAILAALAAINWRRGEAGLVGYVQGEDGRLSTGLTQAAFWTMALTIMLLYFALLDSFSMNEAYNFDTTVGGDEFKEQYLFLLGGPFAAAAAARVLTGAKVDEGTLQKVESSPQFRDVLTDDSGRGNLPDAQFFAFNLVAIAWFVLVLWEKPTELPTLPNVLVGLTSLSALSYTAAKAVAGNKPLITSVTRHVGVGERASELRITPGSSIEIRGSNFVPEGARSRVQLAKIQIRFSQQSATGATSNVQTLPRFILDRKKKITSPSDGSLIAVVPASLLPGSTDVTVITAAGIESDTKEFALEEPPGQPRGDRGEAPTRAEAQGPAAPMEPHADAGAAPQPAPEANADAPEVAPVPSGQEADVQPEAAPDDAAVAEDESSDQGEVADR